MNYLSTTYLSSSVDHFFLSFQIQQWLLGVMTQRSNQSIHVRSDETDSITELMHTYTTVFVQVRSRFEEREN